MIKQNLPKKFKGYSTTELLDMWEQIAKKDGIVPGTPKDKIRTMNHFLRQFEIAPVYQIAAKKGNVEGSLGQLRGRFNI